MTIQLSDHFTYRKLLRFISPSVIMMIFTSIYGVVDGLFVSNILGKTSFAAVNLMWPFLMICGGIGFMFGTGGSALVVKTLGEKKPELAKRYFTMIVSGATLLGIAISLIGIVLIRPIAFWLGADQAMIGDCVLYGRILLGFNITFILQNVFQSFLAAAERPGLGLLVTVAAGVTNMVLDYLFIAVFRWGIAGAAVATGLSQCVGGILPLIYFLCPNTSLLRLRKTRLMWRPLLKACGNGSSELVSNITASVVSMLYNFQLLKYAGEDGIAAYGVLMYTEFVFAAIFIGYSIGSAPIIGYHFGAENHTELKNMLRKSLILMGGFGCAMFAAAQALASPLAQVFVGYDAHLVDMTESAFRIFCISYIIMGYGIFTSSFFTALNNGAVSATISILRTFGFKLLAVLLLPLAFGIDGIWWAAVIAEVLSLIVSAGFLVAKRKQYQYA